MSSSVPPSTSTSEPLAPPSANLHLLLIRHAESYNNVLAERLHREHGDSPYNPNANADLIRAYDSERKLDPELSVLGMRQANVLSLHPHLQDVRWRELVKEGRVRVVTSPMFRAVQTSLPLLREIDRMLTTTPSSPPPDVADTPALPTSALLPSVSPKSLPGPLSLRATLHPDFCERGGLYHPTPSPSGELVNHRNPGQSRAELQAAYGLSHDPSLCKEGGWWNLDGEAEEKDEEYFPRVDRAIAYVLQLARNHVGVGGSEAGDYVLVVSHADFIDSFLTRILRVGNAGHPRHVFYAGNTSISHVELKWGGRGGKGGVGKDKGDKQELSEFEVRVRCQNSMPRRVQASTPPADDANP